MHAAHEGIGSRGELVPGPPWILGHRGAAREAPENTLASLRRAIELGLDGFSCDLRACASGELFLLADATLQRTTNAHGPLALKTLPELAGVDAGGWFGKRFAGEPLALYEEALEIEGNTAGAWPQHLVELREDGLVFPLARILKGRAQRHSVRVASTRRSVCVEARDAGLAAMLVIARAGAGERRFVEAERLFACASTPSGWRTDEAREPWPCERWGLSVDDPADLLEACRLPLNAFHTNEPLRALATRALVFLTPGDTAPYPLEVPELSVTPDAQLPGRGEWCGHWRSRARVRNPFGFTVRVALELVVRRGAFDAHGLPAGVELPPGDAAEIEFELSGGSWSPGGDPLLFAHYFWDPGPGRPGERLSLDAPLVRVRELALDERVQRVPLLRERPGESEASITLRRHGRELLVALENPGGLADAQVLVHLDGAHFVAGKGMRLALPLDFDTRASGVPFSVGITGRERDGRAQRVRRWAGGVPDDPDSGAPGRLVSGARG